MNTGLYCPTHPTTELHLLATTADDRYYCPACDRRYSDDMLAHAQRTAYRDLLAEIPAARLARRERSRRW